MIKKVGGSAVVMPAGEIFAGLQSGAIDAAEFIGPLNDLALGFHQVAKYCYGPGIQEPGGNVQLMVNKAKYQELPEDLQQIIRACAAEGYIDMKSEYDIRSGEAMVQLANEYGVQFMRLPNDVLVGLGTAAGELVAESRESGDEFTKRVWDSYLASRQLTMRTLRFNEQAFLNARTLDFAYPRAPDRRRRHRHRNGPRGHPRGPFAWTGAPHVTSAPTPLRRLRRDERERGPTCGPLLASCGDRGGRWPLSVAALRLRRTAVEVEGSSASAALRLGGAAVKVEASAPVALGFRRAAVEVEGAAALALGGSTVHLEGGRPAGPLGRRRISAAIDRGRAVTAAGLRKR